MKMVMAMLLCVMALVGCGQPNCYDHFEEDCIAQCGNLGNCGFDPQCLDGRFSFHCGGGDMATPCGNANVDADCAASCGSSDGGMTTPGGPGSLCRPIPVCMMNGHWRFVCQR
jgi:hypothetical protein